LDRYIRHGLRLSHHEADHRLAQLAVRQLRVLGWQITETGCQPCASPVGRVMACSRAKAEALVPILTAEHQVLGDEIRAIVVTDFEKSSAVASEVSHLLDAESGGAMAAFRVLISNPSTDQLDPVLLTGSSVLVDDDLTERFQAEAASWLQQENLECTLEAVPYEGFHSIRGSGADWCPRVYVALVTELFQQGITRCLVGTRGLLGEGWDASRINVLVDLTGVTASMSVNQLRGRSIRLDSQQPRKLADNWDVVCIAPEFARGLDDYHRFLKRHETLFGVTDDGAIEKGVGHVHAAFQDLHPEGLEGSTALLNEEMLRRASRREHAWNLWKIGQPYHPEPVRTVETRPVGRHEIDHLPDLTGAAEPWNAESLGLAVGHAVLGALCEAGLLSSNWDVHASGRAGGYVRLFLERAGQEDSAVFARAIHEVFAPLARPRYVIPRQGVKLRETWYTRLLPAVVGRYLQRKIQRNRPELVMLHAVPAVLAKKKELVEIYQRYWNAHVSPGQAVYALHGAGADLIDQARRDRLVPRSAVQEKEVFLSVGDLTQPDDSGSPA
ncbi:MAG: DEAD/DEAH box helicase, partial [Planctomycetaceae bacterium]|nr:DEAD/DEAH box helicase [Planctomycetaceae bacterium]